MFAEYLRDYISKKKLSNKKAAELCGIDRAQLKRYLDGIRLPQEETIVSKIAEGLMMSEDETYQLHIKYRRSKMGETQYKAYRMLQCMYDRTEELQQVSVEIDKIKEQARKLKPADTIYLTGHEAIWQWSYYLCESVSHIYVEVGLECKEILLILRELLAKNQDCMVTFCIVVDSFLKENELETIRTFREVYAFLQMGNPCKIYHRYRSGRFKNEELLTNHYILTERGMLKFSECKEESEPVGLYVSNTEMLSYYEKNFNKTVACSQLYAQAERISESKILQKVEAERTVCTHILRNAQTGICIDVIEKQTRAMIQITRPGIWEHRIEVMENNVVEMIHNFVRDEEEIKLIV